jgi:hypothetical protein
MRNTCIPAEEMTPKNSQNSAAEQLAKGGVERAKPAAQNELKAC